MEDTQATKPNPPRTRRYMMVRYSRMRLLGLFEHSESQLPTVPTRVVVKTEKGLELGNMIGNLGAYRAGQLKLSDDQLKKYFEEAEIPFPSEPVGRFVRFATAEDLNEDRHFKKIADEEADYCRKLIREMKLPMKIVDAEHILGGERIIFYFMSDGRVDFRDLVRKIAQEYQTRIEMRQIGSRDEAKLLGDVESCGQRCCCSRFLKSLKPVNMRMAKLQKATLDPSKISGYCGRLKCCLRYEDQIYTELKHLMPPRSTRVKTKLGPGKVIDYQVLAQLLVIELDNGTRTTVPRAEAEIISQSPHGNAPEKQATEGAAERAIETAADDTPDRLIDSTPDSPIDSAPDSDSENTNPNEPPNP